MESQTHHKMKEKGILKQKPRKDLVVEDYVEESEEEEELGFRNDEDKKRKSVIKRGSNCGIGVSPPCCQIDKCNSDLTVAKPYHRRHKVCEFHSKAPVVVVAGTRQRFCQQCSRFHELSEFDETKRSCRRRLAGHNERRRKSSSESHGEGSNRERMDPQLKESNCRGTDSSVKIRISLSGNGKHSQIR